MLVQLLDVQTASTLMHVDLPVHRRLNLNSLRTVSLLSVELTAIHIIDVHHLSLVALAPSRAVGSGYDCLTGWVVAKVRLIHQLFIER